MKVSNDFGASHYAIQTTKMGCNHVLMYVPFQYRGLHHLELYCILTIEAVFFCCLFICKR